MKDRSTKPIAPVGKQERPSGPVQLTQTLTITKRIGKGRMGVVYAAVHDVLARRFAIKVLRPALTNSDEARHRLRRMVREASQVEHPSIVSLVDFGQVPDGRFYLTMEYVRGMQLSRLIERDGRFSVDRALPLLTQLAEALETAHRGRVVHGDLKPNNLTVVEVGGVRDLLRVHDWMLSSALASGSGQADVLAHLQTYGTVDYLAPEQLSQRNTVDGRMDQYAFGAIAYHLLTGQPPFTGEPDRVVEAHCTREPVPLSRRSGVDDVSDELDGIILRCLEKDPADRFRSMEQVLRALQGLGTSTRVLGSSTSPALLEGPPEPEPSVDVEMGSEQAAEEPLPESPARLRRLLYDTILELSQGIVDHGELEGVGADDEIVQQTSSLKQLREQSTQLAGQVGLTENRFEDIRRELREGESAMRYAIIDLNLAKSDLIEKGRPPQEIDEIDSKIAELEQRLGDLEQGRSQRFAELNEELTRRRDRLKAIEQQMALRFRHLYTQINMRRYQLRSAPSRDLLRRLERCRAALSRAHQTSGVG